MSKRGHCSDKLQSNLLYLLCAKCIRAELRMCVSCVLQFIPFHEEDGAEWRSSAIL